jgi:CubicO group peptidase (beta-lactamase class C family)
MPPVSSPAESGTPRGQPDPSVESPTASSSRAGTQLVRAETLREAFVPGRLTDSTSTGYGFGWAIRQAGDVQVIAHDGGTCGFSTAVRRVPDRRLLVIVLTNRAEAYAPRIADELLRFVLEGK